MTVNAISNVFNLTPLNTKAEIMKPEAGSSIDEANEDFEFARANLMRLIKDTQKSIDELSEVATQSQDAKAYDALSKLTKTLLDANKELLNLQKDIRTINNTASKSPRGKNDTVTITTDELLKLIKKG